MPSEQQSVPSGPGRRAQVRPEVCGVGAAAPRSGRAFAWVLAALCVGLTSVPLACSTDAQAQSPPEATPDTAYASAFDAASEDTIPILDGIGFVNIDSLLLAGDGVLVAFEDTIPFAEGTLDTVLVAAPRVTIDEVVRRIGERLEADFYAIERHEFTGIYTMIARDDPADSSRYTLYEGADRIHRNDDGTLSYARLWERERRYEDGALKSEKVKDEIETEWAHMSRQLAIPFSLESGGQYNYEILDRMLIGMSLVYKMRFTPKDQFAALPSGVVWVDYSDWVIRRFEAEMTGAVPLPMVVKSIPAYKLRRAKRGDWWILSDIYVQAELRRVPLLKIPGSVTLHFRTRDHVINGVAYPDPVAADPGARDRNASEPVVR